MSVFSLTPIVGMIISAKVHKESIGVFQAIVTRLIILLGIFIMSRR